MLVPAGRSISVTLDNRLSIKRAGQPITGTVLDPVYAYDRIVIPPGARVHGRIAWLDPVAKTSRLMAGLSGDFSPARRAQLQFDSLVLPDGVEIPLAAVVTSVNERPRREVAREQDVREPRGVSGRATREFARAKADVERKAKEALATIIQPGRMERLRDALVRRLPYRPQFLKKGSVLTAELTSSIDFGSGSSIVSVESNAAPAPDSVLRARLVTPLDSGKTDRGSLVEAVVTEPLFSEDHQLIVPEGTVVSGTVTFAKRARRFHRSGQLRFLFERLQLPNDDPRPLLASLHSVRGSDDEPVAVDDEGGARAKDSNTRFIAPALALMTVHWSAGHHHHDVASNAEGPVRGPAIQSANVGGRGLGGWAGLGIVGAAAAQISRPVAIVFASVGAARSTYAAVFGRGNDVSFPKNTVIELRLAPDSNEK